MGEKELINEIGILIHQTRDLDWRDDCIITAITDELALLYSVDRPENIFDTGNKKNDLISYGRWSAGIVANDVIACGTKPIGISFDIGSSEFENAAEMKLWISGVLDVCKVYGMKYEGGNIGIGKGITGMSWGIEKINRIIRRKGAMDNDIILATSNIGTGWSLRLWEEESSSSRNSKFEFHEFKSYKQEPWIKLNVFEEIWKLDAINCGMDITDGIIEFGYEIYEQSKQGVIFDFIDNRPFPINDIAKKLNLPEQAFLFEAGYDTPFAHGWSIKNTHIDKVIEILLKNKIPYTILGKTSKDVQGVFLRNNEEKIELPRYWDDVNKTRGSIEIWKKEILPLILKSL